MTSKLLQVLILVTIGYCAAVTSAFSVDEFKNTDRYFNNKLIDKHGNFHSNGKKMGYGKWTERGGKVIYEVWVPEWNAKWGATPMNGGFKTAAKSNKKDYQFTYEKLTNKEYYVDKSSYKDYTSKNLLFDNKMIANNGNFYSDGKHLATGKWKEEGGKLYFAVWVNDWNINWVGIAESYGMRTEGTKNKNVKITDIKCSKKEYWREYGTSQVFLKADDTLAIAVQVTYKDGSIKRKHWTKDKLFQRHYGWTQDWINFHMSMKDATEAHLIQIYNEKLFRKTSSIFALLKEADGILNEFQRIIEADRNRGHKGRDWDPFPFIGTVETENEEAQQNSNTSSYSLVEGYGSFEPRVHPAQTFTLDLNNILKNDLALLKYKDALLDIKNEAQTGMGKMKHQMEELKNDFKNRGEGIKQGKSTIGWVCVLTGHRSSCERKAQRLFDIQDQAGELAKSIDTIAVEHLKLNRYDILVDDPLKYGGKLITHYGSVKLSTT